MKYIFSLFFIVGISGVVYGMQQKYQQAEQDLLLKVHLTELFQDAQGKTPFLLRLQGTPLSLHNQCLSSCMQLALKCDVTDPLMKEVRRSMDHYKLSNPCTLNRPKHKDE